MHSNVDMQTVGRNGFEEEGSFTVPGAHTKRRSLDILSAKKGAGQDRSGKLIHFSDGGLGAVQVARYGEALGIAQMSFRTSRYAHRQT